MKAAIAAVDITPKPGHVLQGHWSTKPSHAVLYPIEVRAIVFEDNGERVAIASTDTVGIERASVARIRERAAKGCGIAGDRILVAASHTHCAPAVLHSLGDEPPKDFLDALENGAADAIIAAAKSTQPVTLALGCGSAHFNINRRPVPGTTGMSLNYGGIVDRRARLLRVDDARGNPLAVMFHYSCHPTTKSGSDGFISPDYPGIARTTIEQALGCRAMFLPGCFGNIRPAIITEKGTFGSATKEQLDACGHELGHAVVLAARSLRTAAAHGIVAKRIATNFPFGDPMPREKLAPMAADKSERGRLLTGPWAKRVLQMMDDGKLPKTEPTEMQMLRVGPLVLVGIPGEPFQEIGHAIEKGGREAAEGMGAESIWPVGYSNDDIGYLCTERSKNETGYEPLAYPYYGRPAPFKGEETLIVETAMKLVRGDRS